MVLIDETQFKANLHAHSTLSDGKYSPEELKKLYKAMGYRILAITDHEKPVDHTELNDPDFLFITGYEAYIRSTPDGTHDQFLPEMHLNLFARKHDTVDQIWPSPCYMKYYRDPYEKEHHPTYGPDTLRMLTPENVNRFIELAHEDGYLVVYNHPGWSLESANDIMRYKGLLSIEMCNGNAVSIGRPEYNANTYDYLLQHGCRLYCHSADDNHNRVELGKPGCDSFLAWTMFNLKDGELSYGNVISAMEAGTFYATQGPEIRHLEINGDRVFIRTTPAQRITLLTNGQYIDAKYAPTWGETIDRAEFIIPSRAAYIRFNVTDDRGRCADTRAYYKGEEYEV